MAIAFNQGEVIRWRWSRAESDRRTRKKRRRDGASDDDQNKRATREKMLVFGRSGGEPGRNNDNAD